MVPEHIGADVGADDAPFDEAIPAIAVDRGHHADDVRPGPEGNGVSGVTRRLVGRLIEGRPTDEARRPAMPREDVEGLRQVLAELLDCKRLLDQAR